MSRILLVEDHENLRASLGSIFTENGFAVHAVGDLAAARAALRLRPDLLVLDWNLPDGQGIDLLGQLRREGSRLPVIFLTARADLMDKVLGLELGADDYVTKPFEPRELLARVRARLRATAAPHEVLEVGLLRVDKVRHEVRFDGQVVALVKKEFDLLALLAEHPEKVFSRDELLNKVWGYDVFPTTSTVDTHVMLLRQKLREDLIETVRAVGYRLRRIDA